MSPPIEKSWAREFPRDQAESGFTPILRKLLYSTTGVLAACFVDGEGECIDYCAALPPFDVKVTGAHVGVVMSEIATRVRRIGGGESWLVHVEGARRDLIARRVDDEYLLVVAVKPRAYTRRLLGGIEEAVAELRREAGIPVPEWDPIVDAVRVEVREAVGWAYAPAAYDEGEQRIEVDDVLGRWSEGTGMHVRVCFRVRNAEGEELTLVHERATDRWMRQRERG